MRDKMWVFFVILTCVLGLTYGECPRQCRCTNRLITNCQNRHFDASWTTDLITTSFISFRGVKDFRLLPKDCRSFMYVESMDIRKTAVSCEEVSIWKKSCHLDQLEVFCDSYVSTTAPSDPVTTPATLTSAPAYRTSSTEIPATSTVTTSLPVNETENGTTPFVAVSSTESVVAFTMPRPPPAWPRVWPVNPAARRINRPNRPIAPTTTTIRPSTTSSSTTESSTVPYTVTAPSTIYTTRRMKTEPPEKHDFLASTTIEPKMRRSMLTTLRWAVTSSRSTPNVFQKETAETAPSPTPKLEVTNGISEVSVRVKMTKETSTASTQIWKSTVSETPLNTTGPVTVPVKDDTTVKSTSEKDVSDKVLKVEVMNEIGWKGWVGVVGSSLTSLSVGCAGIAFCYKCYGNRKKECEAYRRDKIRLSSGQRRHKWAMEPKITKWEEFKRFGRMPCLPNLCPRPPKAFSALDCSRRHLTAAQACALTVATSVEDVSGMSSDSSKLEE